MKVVLAMPCYNEADGITDFLNDIYENLDEFLDHIVVVNDSSTDSTVKVIQDFGRLNSKLEITSNVSNLGHGPSFLNAISKSLDLSPDVVITVDGDGQFQAGDIRDKLIHFCKSELDILECARLNRSDPVFRKFVTYMLRLFIFMRVGERPIDSNTPLRIYRAEALKFLVRGIPQDSLIPNLRISALTRRSRFVYSQVFVNSRQRRGVSAAGSTWRAKRDWLPSKRFIQFCRRALIELLRVPI